MKAIDVVLEPKNMVLGAINKPLFMIGDVNVSAMTLIGLAISLLITIYFAKAIRKAISGILEKSSVAPLLRDKIERVTYYSILFFGVLFSLDNVGINLKSLMAAGAILSVGIGLGLQKVVQQLVNTMILMTEKPIRVGDIIEYGGRIGRVEIIQRRATRILTQDNVSLIIPNSDLITSTIINHSISTGYKRFQIPISVSYKNNPSHVSDVFINTVNSYDKILKQPKASIEFASQNEYSLNFIIHVWIQDLWNSPNILSELRFMINTACTKENIIMDIPYHNIIIQKHVS